VAGPQRADLGWAALLFAVALLLQGLQSENYFDGDTGYHIAVGHYTLQHGILQDFPWTPRSWLGQHYADKELLLHLLLAPLSLLDHNLAARLAGGLMGGALLTALYGVLRVEGVNRAGVWALSLLVLSGAFTHRFVLVRPHLMSITLAVLVLWAAARGRWLALALGCFIFPFAYTAWHLTLALAVIGAVAGLPVQGRRAALALPVAGGALCLGVLLHPNFPNNLSFFWIQNVEVLLQTAWADRPGFELGGEFQPFSPRGGLRYLSLPLACLGLAVVAQLQRMRAAGGLRAALSPAGLDPVAAAASLAGLGMAVMTLKTQRFIEYLAPFSLLALAVAQRGAGGPGWLFRAAAGDRLPLGLLVLGLGWTVAVGSHPLRMLAGRSVIYPPPVEEAVQQLIPSGAMVFHCDWLTVGEAMLALPDRRFLFALDPVLFWRGDPAAYQLWFDLLHAPVEAPGAQLRAVIGADYVLCDARPAWDQLRANLAADPALAGPVEVGPLQLWKVLPAAQGSTPGG
jgi:hypothetical protein